MSSLTGITETEDLALFLRERMQDYDAGVDTTTGSSFYNTVMQPLLVRLGPDPYNTPIREFCLGRLSVEFPEMVLQDGEPIDDLVIKPMQVLLEAFRRQIQQVSNNQSLEDPSILNEREADALGANFFVRRRAGGLSVGVARIYYSAPQGSLVTPNNAVYDGSGHRFFPVENQGISADNMLFNVEDNLFYFDIIVRAESEGEEYNIPVNTLTGIEEFPSAVKVSNKASFEEGAEKESTEDYIARVENSLTEKSLVTLRGITARLTDVFETIRLIQVIGYGDPEMNRDILTGESDAPAPYAFFIGSTGNFPLSTDTNDGATTAATGSFVDNDASFQTDGVSAGFLVRILSGVDAGDYTVLSVPSETEILVSGLFTTTAGGLNYRIIDPTTSRAQVDIGTASPNILGREGDLDTSFLTAGVRVGDKLTYVDVLTSTVDEYEILSIGTTSIQVTPDIPGTYTNVNFTLSKAEAGITISGIPGGILQPETPAGTIEVDADSLHLGGMVDVFVRAGAPVQRDTVLEGVLDGDPLHFGVDLESFGEREDEFVHITEAMADAAMRPSTDRFGNAVDNHLLIQTYLPRAVSISGDLNDGETLTPALPGDPNFQDTDATFVSDGVVAGQYLVLVSGPDSGGYEILEVLSETELLLAGTFTPTSGLTYGVFAAGASWVPTEDDVGRYVEILPTGAPGSLGLLEILSVESTEYPTTTNRATRITVDVSENHYNPGNPFALGSSAAFDVDIRLVEKVPITDRVRDRDGSRTLTGAVKSGADLRNIGAAVGDSVVIETGDDAGIYSVRKVLDWLDTGDTLILDRALTKTQTPTGFGDGSGLRYRIADELNVDLVSPKVTKIPLGTVFTGDDLSTLADSAVVTAGGTTNFLLAGVEVGDTLEILEGDDKGSYTVEAVVGTNVTLDAPMTTTRSTIEFTVYRAYSGVARPLVRVKEIELLDSNSQPTGIKIPYGTNIDARALGVFSNRAEGSQQESFTGVTLVGTGGRYIRLRDAEVDFVAEGVVPGFRLNIFNTGSVGRYTITKVGTGDGLPTDHYIEVADATEGGTEFLELTTAVHYSVGLPSSGVARIYFMEPTTVEILTGLSGGRINYEEQGSAKAYHFSEVPGFTLLPAGGSGDEYLRDIRVVRSYEEGAAGSEDWRTILELTDDTAPGVFGQEIRVGDVVEVNESIPLRSSSGKTLLSLGVFGKPAGLRTVAGSNRVTVPPNSLIDFEAMDIDHPLAGQKLIIDEGADAGEYVIEEVVDSKTLRLNQLMTGSTETIIHKESGTLRDATLTPGSSSITLEDLTDNPGTQIGNFITIFESTRGDIDGTFEIMSVPAASQVELDMSPTDYLNVDYLGGDIDPFGVGLFSWVNTTGEDNVGHAFQIYKSVPKQAEIVEVATKRLDVDLKGVGDIYGSPAINFEDTSATFVTDGVAVGDQLEILSGPSVGVYPIASVPDETHLVVVNNAQTLFPTTGGGNPYRVWGGLHGSRTMITVGPYESDNGKINFAERMPFRIVRPKVFRVCSTEMESNYDGAFYYVDVQVESLGSGDEFNLDRLDRMVVKSGLSADGYTYTVGNNNLTFSTYEQVSLNFDRRFLPVGNSDSPENLTEVSGRNLKVVYETSTTVKLVHDLMRSDQERPINANPLARHFLPSYVYTQLYYRGGPSVSEVGPAIEAYINYLGAQGELEVSDLEAFIARRDATSIEHPITIAVITHDIDRVLVVNRTENRLGGELEVPYNGTGRISAFFATLGESLIVEKRS